MEHLYSDRMLFFGDVCFMLHHDASTNVMRVTVRAESESDMLCPMVVAARILAVLDGGVGAKFGVQYRLELSCPCSNCNGTIIAEDATPPCIECTTIQKQAAAPWVGNMSAQPAPLSELRQNINSRVLSSIIDSNDQDAGVALVDRPVRLNLTGMEKLMLCSFGGAVLIISELVPNFTAGSLPMGLVTLVVGSSLVVSFPMVSMISAQLSALPPSRFADNEFGTGLLGLFGVVLGILDIFSAVNFPIKLVVLYTDDDLTCPENKTSRLCLKTLSTCCIVSLAVTMASTCKLALDVLSGMARVPRVAEWLQTNYAAVSALILASITRLENLRVL